jgi:hypothetical protein
VVAGQAQGLPASGVARPLAPHARAGAHPERPDQLPVAAHAAGAEVLVRPARYHAQRAVRRRPLGLRLGAAGGLRRAQGGQPPYVPLTL